MACRSMRGIWLRALKESGRVVAPGGQRGTRERTLYSVMIGIAPPASRLLPCRNLNLSSHVAFLKGCFDLVAAKTNNDRVADNDGGERYLRVQRA